MDSATELAYRIAERHSPGALRITRLVGRGVVNHVFVVGAPGLDWVIRFAVDSHESSNFEIEEWCLRQAPAVGIPSPAVIARGEYEGAAYIVQSFVPGQNGEDVSRSDAWSQLGAYAALLRHICISTDCPNSLFSRFGRNLKQAWRLHIEYNISALSNTDPLIGLGIYAAFEQPLLKSALTRLLHADFAHFGVCHGDLAPRNLIVPDSKPAVLLDWGAALTGPTPWRDLETVYRWYLTEGALTRKDLERFSAACGIDLSEAIPTLEMMLLVRAMDLVRWCLERRPDLLPQYQASGRASVRRFLNISEL